MPRIRAPPIGRPRLYGLNPLPLPHTDPRVIHMQIMMINNDGGGFADHIEVAEGTTVSALFAEKIPGRKAADYLIRVNRQPASGDQILQPGDRITIVPTKIEGAIAA